MSIPSELFDNAQAFCSAFAEEDAIAHAKPLGSLDEAECDCRAVACADVLSVDADDRACLADWANVEHSGISYQYEMRDASEIVNVRLILDFYGRRVAEDEHFCHKLAVYLRGCIAGQDDLAVTRVSTSMSNFKAGPLTMPFLTSFRRTRLRANEADCPADVAGTDSRFRSMDRMVVGVNWPSESGPIRIGSPACTTPFFTTPLTTVPTNGTENVSLMLGDLVSGCGSNTSNYSTYWNSNGASAL